MAWVYFHPSMLDTLRELHHREKGNVIERRNDASRSEEEVSDSAENEEDSAVDNDAENDRENDREKTAENEFLEEAVVV